MYELVFGISVIIFLAVIIYPQQPIAAVFWMGGITVVMTGLYCANTMKIPFVLAFVILMILGTLFMFGLNQ